MLLMFLLQCVGDVTAQEEEAASALLLLQTATSVHRPQDPSDDRVARLMEENMTLRKQIAKLEKRCKKLEACNFSVNTVHTSAFKFYTGLQSREQFEALYKHLEQNAQCMTYRNTEAGGQAGTTKDRQLTKRDELFMVLYRLRTGVCAKEIGRMFGVSESTLSRIFCTWINFLDKELSALTRLPTLREVQQHIPPSFHNFSNTRIVLDCTEVRIQKPSKLKAQRQTFSTYKHFNTFKALVGVTPDGYVAFVPDLWGGHVSDTEIVQKSGLIDLLQPGDGVMADKGFRLDTVFPPGIDIYIPPFKRGQQLSASDVVTTRKIAGARIHVERAIRRIKEFHFLDKPIPINMLDIADSIFRTCAFLCNFQDAIISTQE